MGIPAPRPGLTPPSSSRSPSRLLPLISLAPPALPLRPPRSTGSATRSPVLSVRRETQAIPIADGFGENEERGCRAQDVRVVVKAVEAHVRNDGDVVPVVPRPSSNAVLHGRKQIIHVHGRTKCGSTVTARDRGRDKQYRPRAVHVHQRYWSAAVAASTRASTPPTREQFVPHPLEAHTTRSKPLSEDQVASKAYGRSFSTLSVKS